MSVFEPKKPKMERVTFLEERIAENSIRVRGKNVLMHDFDDESDEEDRLERALAQAQVEREWRRDKDRAKKVVEAIWRGGAYQVNHLWYGVDTVSVLVHGSWVKANETNVMAVMREVYGFDGEGWSTQCMVQEFVAWVRTTDDEAPCAGEDNHNHFVALRAQTWWSFSSKRSNSKRHTKGGKWKWRVKEGKVSAVDIDRRAALKSRKWLRRLRTSVSEVFSAEIWYAALPRLRFSDF